MPLSLAAVYLHLVFSTKDRAPFLRDDVTRAELHRYLGGVTHTLDCPSIEIGGVEAMSTSWRVSGGRVRSRNG